MGLRGVLPLSPSVAQCTAEARLSSRQYKSTPVRRCSMARHSEATVRPTRGSPVALAARQALSATNTAPRGSPPTHPQSWCPVSRLLGTSVFMLCCSHQHCLQPSRSVGCAEGCARLPIVQPASSPYYDRPTRVSSPRPDNFDFDENDEV